jgi:DNA-binding PadR family transcriptional regulator
MHHGYDHNHFGPDWDDYMRRPPHPGFPPRPRWGRGHGGGDAWADFLSEWWRGPTPRAERGAVRYLILDAIRTQPRHGYDIIQAIEEKSHGAYKPSAGVVYPTLQMLEEMRLTHVVEQGDRKVYELTPEGRVELEAHDDEVAEFYEGHEDAAWDVPAEEVARVMKRIGLLIRAFKRGARRGALRPARIRKMLTVLDEALNKLQALIGEDE